jgi:transitional endoplasmic reticulum ATPase
MADRDRAVELTVRGAEKRDAGRGIARLSETARRELGVLSGDTLVVEGDRATVAKCWPARPDTDPGTVRIDADTRANAGAHVGGTVRVSAVPDLPDAGRVRLAAVEPVDLDAETVRTAVRDALRERPVAPGQTVRVERLDAGFRVVDVEPDGIVRVTAGSDVAVEVDGEAGGDGDKVDTAPTGERDGADGADAAGEAPTPVEGVTYEDIGGLDDELDLVREMVELPLAEPELFARLGVEPPKGVLLYGPPGTGKTLIARAVANEVNATFITVSGPEIMSKYKGESEERLRDVFARARREAPSVVFFDEIDSLAGKRGDESDVESRVVGQLLSVMDGLEARGDVVVVGATNRVDALDPALRRGGRFDREIEVGAPNEAGRREILDVHARGVPLGADVDLDRIAARTHGFVGADLAALVKEAAMAALRRSRRTSVAIGDIEVTRGDFESALAGVEPSAMREYVAERPTEGFEAVGGLEDARAALERAVSWPLTYGPLFEAADAQPPTGVLLYGPPGTGKTLLARAIAAESGVNFIQVAGPELLDRYVGESEKAVRELFDRARQAAPAIVFLDEIDAIARDRNAGGESAVGERVVSQLLTELDRAADNPSLVVLAATNRREALDPALRRPGRLEAHIEVPAPDEAGRRAVLDVHAAAKPLGADVDLDRIAARTDGYTGADLEAVCREASMRAVRELTERYGGEAANDHADELVVRADHFDAALDAVEPSRSG